MYNECIEIHNDDQLLKKILGTEACYLRLMKDIEVKDDGVPLVFFMINYNLKVRKKS